MVSHLFQSKSREDRFPVIRLSDVKLGRERGRILLPVFLIAIITFLYMSQRPNRLTYKFRSCIFRRYSNSKVDSHWIETTRTKRTEENCISCSDKDVF